MVQGMALYWQFFAITSLTIISAAILTGSAEAEDGHLGVIEYELACMPCHGVDGRGDGPAAKQLQVRPSDLTNIAKINGGRFPFARIVKIVDGRQLVAAHGVRAMPVWGNRYRVTVEPGETAAKIERRARQRISALVRYLAEIQRP